MRRQSVDRAKLEQVCERAAKFHRLQMISRATPLELEYEIHGVPARSSSITVRPDGWAIVGIVRDEVQLWSLDVWWHPETDRIKLQKPPAPLPDPRPTQPRMMGTPLYRPILGSPVSAIRPWIAMPGYIYTYQGRDYSHVDAERLVTELDSDAGWTWRPVSM